jgi:hypothetical protein
MNRWTPDFEAHLIFCKHAFQSNFRQFLSNYSLFY